MPVTAKLSRRFYERVGDEVANDLVEWMNAVDATYRGELRDLNELNFARFDAKLEQRLSDFEAKIETKSEQRLGAFEANLKANLKENLKTLEDRIVGNIKTSVVSKLVLWMLLFWTASALAVAALVSPTVQRALHIP